MGAARRPRQCAVRRIARRRHHEPARRVPPQERRALQREREGHGILRRRRAAQQWPADGRHHGRGRSSVSDTALHRKLTLQERTGRWQMGSDAVLVNVVTRRAALALFLLLWAPAGVFAQAELSGSWAARNTEDISRDSYPVDYLGLPLNDEGRTRALTYNESQLAMIERQCEGWPPFYFVQGPFGLKIWGDTEPVKGGAISWTIGGWEDRAPMT